ncbi:hypothetical protein TL16_g06407 [Triparma laevis f. inornata]|uniref:Uncharacterized protein n=1 Tax=Triparma laevis f. inornata TaxID=1714386 RepID=A0A9W7ECV3_9STRA|nr:hypothetical protein TL16_g06407 [Triparma laevis f. inornata]
MSSSLITNDDPASGVENPQISTPPKSEEINPTTAENTANPQPDKSFLEIVKSFNTLRGPDVLSGVPTSHGENRQTSPPSTPEGTKHTTAQTSNRTNPNDAPAGPSNPHSADTGSVMFDLFGCKNDDGNAKAESEGGRKNCSAEILDLNNPIFSNVTGYSAPADSPSYEMIKAKDEETGLALLLLLEDEKKKVEKLKAELKAQKAMQGRGAWQQPTPPQLPLERKPQESKEKHEAKLKEVRDLKVKGKESKEEMKELKNKHKEDLKQDKAARVMQAKARQFGARKQVAKKRKLRDQHRAVKCIQRAYRAYRAATYHGLPVDMSSGWEFVRHLKGTTYHSFDAITYKASSGTSVKCTSWTQFWSHWTDCPVPTHCPGCMPDDRDGRAHPIGLKARNGKPGVRSPNVIGAHVVAKRWVEDLEDHEYIFGIMPCCSACNNSSNEYGLFWRSKVVPIANLNTGKFVGRFWLREGTSRSNEYWTKIDKVADMDVEADPNPSPDKRKMLSRCKKNKDGKYDALKITGSCTTKSGKVREDVECIYVDPDDYLHAISIMHKGRMHLGGRNAKQRADQGEHVKWPAYDINVTSVPKLNAEAYLGLEDEKGTWKALLRDEEDKTRARKLVRSNAKAECDNATTTEEILKSFMAYIMVEVEIRNEIERDKWDEEGKKRVLEKERRRVRKELGKVRKELGKVDGAVLKCIKELEHGKVIELTDLNKDLRHAIHGICKDLGRSTKSEDGDKNQLKRMKVKNGEFTEEELVDLREGNRDGKAEDDKATDGGSRDFTEKEIAKVTEKMAAANVA